MDILYTKKDFLDIFSTMGIDEGMVVLVQADLTGFNEILSGSQAIIEALQELVKEDGCIICPTFSLSCLDPACYEQNDYTYESWNMIRDNMLGYDPKLTSCDVYADFANQFLKNENVRRTNHPVYSFAFWGTYDEKCLEQSLNFPISFSRVFREFVDRRACNILIGEKIENSLLWPAMAKTMNQGILTIKRAIINQGRGKQLKNFLNLEVDQERMEEYKKMCYIQSSEYSRKAIHFVSLDTSEESI